MFANRQQAGHSLAKRLLAYRDQKNAVVYAVPRGGVVIGRVVSDALHLPLDIVVVKKISAPQNPELAIGAVSVGGVNVLDQLILETLQVPDAYVREEIRRKTEEVEKRLRLYKKRSTKPTSLAGKTVILTDDGIATGATTEAAIRFLRSRQARSIILAVPIAPHDTIQKLERLVDEVIVLDEPESFNAVGQFYQSFPQVDDQEVITLLK